MAEKKTLFRISDGGPRLIDLNITSSSLVLMVNLPGMNIGKFRVLTSLDVDEGAQAEACRAAGPRSAARRPCGRRASDEPLIDSRRGRSAGCGRLAADVHATYCNEASLSTVRGRARRFALRARHRRGGEQYDF